MGLPLFGPVATHACAAIPDQEQGCARYRRWVGSLELVGLRVEHRICVGLDSTTVLICRPRASAGEESLMRQPICHGKCNCTLHVRPGG